MKSIKKVAIANRGEVAVRIIHACHELGLRTVLLHSEADVETRAFRMSDEKICIGPAATAESYLKIESNIQGALSAGADAIHPGYGFLSERAHFARACEEAGLIFVGPPAASLEKMGSKIGARRLMQDAGRPCQVRVLGEHGFGRPGH